MSPLPITGRSWCSSIVCGCVLWILSSCLTSTALASGPLQVTSVSALDIEALQGLIDANDQLAQESKDALTASLAKARGFLAEQESETQMTLQLRNAVDGAESRIVEFRDRPAASTFEVNSQAISGFTVVELERQQSVLFSERTRLRDRDVALQSWLNQSDERTAKTQPRVRAINQRQAVLTQKISSAPQSLSGQVTQYASVAERQALTAERERLDVEVVTEPLRAELAVAEREWIARSLAANARQITLLEDALQRLRSANLQSKSDEGDALAAQVLPEYPELIPLAESNRQLIDSLRVINQRQSDSVKIRDELRTELDQIRDNASLMRRRLEVAGQKVAFATVMVELLNALPDTRGLARTIEYNWVGN